MSAEPGVGLLDTSVVIAQAALTFALPLYTSNPRDFDGITGLEVRAV